MAMGQLGWMVLDFAELIAALALGIAGQALAHRRMRWSSR